LLLLVLRDIYPWIISQKMIGSILAGDSNRLIAARSPSKKLDDVVYCLRYGVDRRNSTFALIVR